MSTSRWLTWTPRGSIFQKSPGPEPPKPSINTFEGFAGASPELMRKIMAEPPNGEGDSKRAVFPYCPRCASYALYRKNNIGNFECLTCELRDIPEEVARRVQ